MAWVKLLDRADRERWEGKLIEELHRRHSWAHLVDVLEIAQTTLWNRERSWRKATS